LNNHLQTPPLFLHTVPFSALIGPNPTSPHPCDAWFIANMGKAWLSEIPAEVRVLVYQHLFSSHTVRMHWPTCSCNIFCQFRSTPSGGCTLASSDTLPRHGLLTPDLEEPRCARIPACLHTNLFLTCKTVLKETQQPFYRLTSFQTHPACLTKLPRLLEKFSSHYTAWRIGYLCDLKPHNTGSLICANGEMFSISYSY
jgi:hypothetical protein